MKIQTKSILVDEGFNLPDKKSDYEYGRNTELTSALKEINKQKQDYIVHGGKDANFILELEKMEDDYKDRFKSKYYSNKDEYLPSNDRFSKDNLLDGYPLMPKSNRSIFQENVRFPGYDETLSVRQKIVELKTTGQNIDNMLKNSNENLYLLQNKLSSSLAPTEIKGDAVHIQTEEERLLNEYRAQEQEIMKALASIAPGTDIYKYKISQLKRLGDLKRELEKIIQEQRQQRLWNQVKEKKQVKFQ